MFSKSARNLLTFPAHDGTSGPVLPPAVKRRAASCPEASQELGENYRRFYSAGCR